MDEQHEWLKVPEVAQLLRVARSRAYELVADGEIPAVRIGCSVRVAERSLTAGSPTAPAAKSERAPTTPTSASYAVTYARPSGACR